MKKSGVPLLLGIIFMTLMGVQGSPVMKKGRCFCINTNQGLIHLKSLKDLRQFSPSPSCEKTEIIATLRSGDQICLNPDSTKVKKLIQEWEKKFSQKKKQKKGRKISKKQKLLKVKPPQRPHQKKTA